MIGAWEPGRYGDLPCVTSSVNRTDPGTLLFIGDLHVDSPHACRDEIRRVLSEAVERNAAIVLLGDVFDAMQSVGDRRANKSALQARYGRDDYIDALVEDVSEFLRPYVKNIWICLHGNHETALMKHHETDVLRRLVLDLNQHGGQVIAPGYQTYVAVRTFVGGQYPHVTLGWLTHGSGGSSPVTKGAIGAARRATTYPDAAFVVSGHLHTDLQVAHPQYRVSSKGRLYATRQRHVQCGAWKVEGQHGPSWAVEKGLPPTVPSAYWLEFRRARGEKAVPRVCFRFVEAN